MFGSIPSDAVPRHDEGRLVSTADEAGNGSGGHGRLLLWECDAAAYSDGEEGTAVHGQDPGDATRQGFAVAGSQSAH
jgi:hypothetical protein